MEKGQGKTIFILTFAQKASVFDLCKPVKLSAIYSERTGAHPNVAYRQIIRLGKKHFPTKHASFL